MSGRDFVIRYIDNEDETINVSDDEDLLTAYDIAERDLKGSLKLTVQFKSQLQRSVTATTSMPFTPREESKREEVPTATSNEAARLLSKQALKKAMKEAQREAARREKMEAKKAQKEALKKLPKPDHVKKMGKDLFGIDPPEPVIQEVPSQPINQSPAHPISSLVDEFEEFKREEPRITEP